MLSRTPHTRTIKVTYPNGETAYYLHTPNIFLELQAIGVPKEKMNKILDYLWNMVFVMVKTVETA